MNSSALFWENFHFMRPAWLLLTPGVLWIFWRLRQHTGASDWPAFVSPHLLQYLVTQTGAGHRQQRSALHHLWLAVGLIMILALAGPAWKRLPQPVEARVDALVIVLDLSLSMSATDVTPSRIARARFKIQDILNQRKEGLTGLVVYAGDAHTVVPLTEDTANIAALLPSLTPWLMPVKGSRPDLAIAQAVEILAGGTQGLAKHSGHILLITDALKPDEIAGVKQHLANTRHHVSILTIGTKQGAPITLPNGQYLKDQAGHLVLPKLDLSAIRAFAAGINAPVTPMSNTDADIKKIFRTAPTFDQTQETALDTTQDVWQDEAFWLVWLLIPLGALLFRRGYLLTVLSCAVCLGSLTPQVSYAVEWSALWQNKDQRAQKAFEAGDYEAAKNLFENPEWRRATAYRAENYAEAASDALNTNTAQDHYNRANALALSGDLKGALQAYDTALAENPDFEDATHNRKIVEALLEQMEQEQAQQQSQQEPQQQENGQNDRQQSDQNSQAGSKDQSNDGSAQNSQAQQQQQPQNSDAENASTQNAGQQQSASNQSDRQRNDSESQAQSDAEAELDALQQRQEAAAAQAAAAQNEDAQAPENTHAATAAQALTPEEKAQVRAAEEQKQALERVIDDPGGLLRRKFILESRKRQSQRQPSTDAQIW